MSRRLLAAAIGLALPLAFAASADAATRHRHPARVSTATYKASPQKGLRHHASATTRSRVVAKTTHRNLTRGS